MTRERAPRIWKFLLTLFLMVVAVLFTAYLLGR